VARRRRFSTEPFGPTLERLMQDSGVTYRALADQTKLSAGYLNHLVHGNRPVPSDDIVERLAKSHEEARGDARADRSALPALGALIGGGRRARSLLCAGLVSALCEALDFTQKTRRLLFELVRDELPGRPAGPLGALVPLVWRFGGVFHRRVDIVEAGNAAVVAGSAAERFPGCGQPEAVTGPRFQDAYGQSALRRGDVFRPLFAGNSIRSVGEG
jgi:transcriptional regulator with XRE-family HTH domain